MWNIDFCLFLMTVTKDVSFRIFWAFFVVCCLFRFFRGKNCQHLLSSVLIQIEMSKLIVPKCNAESKLYSVHLGGEGYGQIKMYVSFEIWRHLTVSYVSR